MGSDKIKQEKMSEMEDKIEELLQASKHKKKLIHINKHTRTLAHHQKPNLRIHGVEEGAEIQTKGNEIIAENFPNQCNNVDTHVQEAFRLQIEMIRKEQPQDRTKVEWASLGYRVWIPGWEIGFPTFGHTPLHDFK
jgi:hypothetical protein